MGQGCRFAHCLLDKNHGNIGRKVFHFDCFGHNLELEGSKLAEQFARSHHHTKDIPHWLQQQHSLGLLARMIIGESFRSRFNIADILHLLLELRSLELLLSIFAAHFY